jgi:hypothetical protein
MMMMMKAKTFIGKLCVRGCGGERYVSSGDCVQCSRTRSRTRHRADPQKYLAIRRARYAKDPIERERRKAASLAVYKKRDVPKYRALRRKRQGMPDPTRPEPSTCECCGRLPNGKGCVLHLDHCHISGAFRGWLCHDCNTGLGKLGDSINGLMNAVRYLERAAKQQEI